MSTWIVNSELSPPRACDRCHSIKERCRWLPGKSQCERCVRLKHVCETVRPKGRPGRKPAARRDQQSPGIRAVRDGNSHVGRTSCARAAYSRMKTHEVVPRSIQDLQGVPAGDQQMVQRILFQSNLLDLFSVGTSFKERVRQQVIPHLMVSKATLLDGLLACAFSWVDDNGDPRQLSSCYRYASSALATLTSLTVTSAEDMMDCLMLGALVSSFAVKLRLSDVLAICAQTLALIKPIYINSDASWAEPLVFMSCMVMWELRGCLFSCGLPTLRFKAPPEGYVDRHVGLFAPLLPYFYDLCKLSNSLSNNEGSEAEIVREVEAIEKIVRAWQPVAPEDFIKNFTILEVTHMLCQVQVMRQAVLLFAHRLRHPFGVNDGAAQVLSMSILSQLETTYIATQHSVRCIDLALFIACIELKGDERDKWTRELTKYTGFSSQFGEHVKDTLLSLWEGIDKFDTLSWSDLTNMGSPFLRNQL